MKILLACAMLLNLSVQATEYFCQSNWECAPYEHCLDQICQPEETPCFDDFQCQPFGYCESGKCVDFKQAENQTNDILERFE